MSATNVLHSRQRNELLEDLSEVYETFSGHEAFSGLFQILQKGVRRFIGVNCELEDNSDLRELRRSLLKEINCEDAKILQVVGDSGLAFDENLIPRALQILSEHAGENYIIEYGYTAIKHDANWLVAEQIRTSPSKKLRAIANIVGQSIECLQDPTWEGSLHVTSFVMLYRNEQSTNFGDDVWLSDGIMFADFDDKLLCFEGGLQALRQCVNMLLKGVQVVAVTDLRSTNNRDRFSAARLLCLLKAPDSSRNNLQANEYLELVLGRDTERLQVVQGLLCSLLESTRDWKSLISIP